MTERNTIAFHVPRSIGPGRVLMHNTVRHTINHPQGLNGFRSWTDTKPAPGFKKCNCGWSGLPHYSKMTAGYKCDSAAYIKHKTGAYIPPPGSPQFKMGPSE